MINIPEGYEQLELRAGYKVSANRKKLWVSELKMLDWLENLCLENNLDFFLIGGSELGVVRHGGFVPWDDDIDIGMLRTDFDRFIQIARENNTYTIQYGLDKLNGIYDRICRIRDNSTTGIVYDQVGKDRSHGAFIEVYPYDFVPKKKKEQQKHAKIVMRYQNLMFHKLRKSNGLKWKIIMRLFGRVSPGQLEEKLEKLYRKYNGEKRENVSSVTLPKYYYSGSEVLPYKYVVKSRYESFEFIKTRIPTEAEKCLTIEYGDYMTLPPVEERGKHHDELVFYDPNNSWEKYRNYGSVKELFKQYGYLLDL